MNLPNKLTMLRILLIPLFVIFALMDAQFAQYVALLIYIGACITDTLDGRIARSRHLVTNFGKFADPIADKLLVMSALVVLVAIRPHARVGLHRVLAREFHHIGFPSGRGGRRKGHRRGLAGQAQDGVPDELHDRADAARARIRRAAARTIRRRAREHTDVHRRRPHHHQRRRIHHQKLRLPSATTNRRRTGRAGSAR